jgi:endonuclease/exonuclease/phosphatase family metal-dependent hydrolase
MAVRIGNFARPVLRVGFQPPKGDPVFVFVAHLKSKAPMILTRKESALVRKHTGYSGPIGAALSAIRRTAEAAALRIELEKTMKGNDYAVVVMGDLNDAHLSVTTGIISGEPKHKVISATRVGHKSDTGLYSAATLQQYRSLRDVYYTHIWRSRHEVLDHIMASEQFYDHSHQRVWSFVEAEVFNDYLVDGDTHDADYKKAQRATTDHGAVKATFVYAPYKQ